MLHLYAREPRWRIVEVRAMSETGHIYCGEVQERKTYDGAVSVQKRWAENGRRSIIQGGIVEWAPAESWEATWQAADFMETQNH